jgi:glycosyltransferase involved in cell wall biosynthesis
VIALDLSRLLSRTGHPTPTGIDRVELAHAWHLIRGGAPHCFAARNVFGRIGLLPTPQARQFVVDIAATWRTGATPDQQQHLASLARRLKRAALFGESALHDRLRRNQETSIYLSVSHQNLDRARSIARLKAATGAKFVCLIHDLIPLEFPSLTRPGQTRRHRRRIGTVAALVDAVIANSTATRDALSKYLGPKPMRIAVAPLGIDLADVPAAPATPPYFVFVGTIEARKNHRLLLDLWQRLAAELGDRTPRLILIGQRGFGSEQNARRLCALQGLVTERPGLPDEAMTALLRGSRALLLPSLAEGFGLPVAEALASGVPVLCSNLPALRETGGNVPDYVDPTDSDAWHRAVLDYAADSSHRRAQLARLASWQKPCWATHFSIVERLLAELG